MFKKVLRRNRSIFSVSASLAALTLFGIVAAGCGGGGGGGGGPTPPSGGWTQISKASLLPAPNV